MRPTLAALAFLLAASPALTATPVHADAFTPAQRQEIVGILRDALRQDPSILRDAIAAVQADDERRHDQVTRDTLTQLAPKLVDSADPVAGNPFGDVTVVEFYDTRCPYCRGMLQTVAALLQSDPKVKLVMKDMPILGNASQLESRALLAAQKQGAYFQLQAPIMQSAATPNRDTLRAEADREGLDGSRLLRDMDDPAVKARLDGNIALAQQIGIDGTPAFIIGTKLISGAVELQELQRAVAQARLR